MRLLALQYVTRSSVRDVLLSALFSRIKGAMSDGMPDGMQEPPCLLG